MPHALDHPGRRSPALLALAIVCAAIVFATSALTMPESALGASQVKLAACGVNLRTSPYTTARLRTSIRTNTKVTIAATVSGGRWRATCAGKAVSGRSWYRISAINGRSVRSLYGRSYLYAASGLFKAIPPAPFTRYAACNAYLRTTASTSATARTLIPTDTRVTVVTGVTGTAYDTTCAGQAASGTAWYQISAIGGATVQALYGVPYVYGAQALFKTAPTPPPAQPVTPTPTPTPTPQPTPMPGTTDGIDVSHWQGPIDWPAVAAAGKRFVFMKASEDTWYVDPTYPTNRAGAGAAGLYVGAYHFAQPNATLGSGTAQADHFLDTATPAAGDLPPVVDLERSGGLGQVALTAWVRDYVERIYERMGVRAVIYCSPNFWRNYMGDTTWFAANGYDILWIAHWTTAPSPSMPGANWGGHGWTFWQYTSDGAVPGITGRVDLDRYNGTDFAEVLIPAGTTILPPPPEPPPPSPSPS